MKKIDVLACVLGITTGFVGLAILQVCLEIHARLRKEEKGGEKQDESAI
ncbi:hypothetical protein ES702_00453 [subsurface metagenome]